MLPQKIDDNALQDDEDRELEEDTSMVSDGLRNSANVDDSSSRSFSRVHNDDSDRIASSAFPMVTSGNSIRRTSAKRIPGRAYLFVHPPPSSHVLMSTFTDYGMPNRIYQDPFYAHTSDVPDRTWEYAGLEYHLKGNNNLNNLEDWGDESSTLLSDGWGWADQHVTSCSGKRYHGWEYAGSPPSHQKVEAWLKSPDGRTLVSKVVADNSQVNLSPFLESHSMALMYVLQLKGPTQRHPYGLKYTPPMPQKHASKQGMTVLAVEVFGMYHEP